tara:strand:+ start:108 stop:488 length:381 start_codon:yes stop_codon:yes gene_type:complete
MTEPTQALTRTTYGAVFGRVLVEKRHAAQKEQEDMAEALGVSQSTYSRIERGHVSVTLEMLARIAELFGETPASLLQEADAAAEALQNVGVGVLPDRSPKSDGDTMLAILGGAALAALMLAALAKK